MKQGQTCKTCTYFEPNEGNEAEGNCRYDPPKVFVFPGTNRLSQQTQLMPTAAYPPVIADDIGCGKHSQKNGVEGLNITEGVE